MKNKSFLLWCLLLITSTTSAQFNAYDRPSYARQENLPTLNEMYQAAQIRAINNQRRAQAFEHYQEIAYEYYNKGNYRMFLEYSSRALSTNLYNAKLYHYRGLAYLSLGQINYAKTELRKAKRKGYSSSGTLLKTLKHRK